MRWAMLLLLARVCGAELTVAVDRPTVGQCGRVEFALGAGVNAANPYDPEQVDLAVEVTAPSGRRFVVPAFYHQPFEMKPLAKSARNAWLYPAGAATWKARFAPSEVGRYSAVAVHRQTGGKSAAVTFECTASKARGPIRVSETDRRYFEFADKTPFFAIGQNVAFVTNPFVTMDRPMKIGAAGGNWARVWVCAEDWGLAIEAKKSAWTRTWLKNPPIVADPEDGAKRCVQIGAGGVKCDPSEPVGLRGQTKYVLSGKVRTTEGASVRLEAFGGHVLKSDPAGKWTAFQVEFTSGANQVMLAPFSFKLVGEGTGHLRDLQLREAAGGPNLLWEADTDRPTLGVYNEPDAYMLDRIVEAAEEAGVYLQLTLLTRNQYMNDLAKEDSPAYGAAIKHAKNLLWYAVARWGYSTHVMTWEFFNENNPGLPTDRFYDELGKYLEEIDPQHHVRATSTWSSPSKDFAHPRLDQADTHFYLRPAEKEIWKDAVAAVGSRWAKLSPKVKDRPFMFSEFGITDDQWKHAKELDADKEFHHWHDAIWASALSGFAGTAAHWFWDDLDRRDLYGVMTGFSRYAADVPWTTGKLRAAQASVDRSMRVMGLQNDTSAYLFISDPSATWHAIAVEGRAAGTVEGATLTLPSLERGRYAVEWWDTRAGRILSTQTVAHDAQVRVPSFVRDIACKVRAAP